MARKTIVAEMREDGAYPYRDFEYPFIPVVVRGSHPRFVPGTRFDYGFLQLAVQDGYKVTIIPAKRAAVKAAAEAYAKRREAKRG